MSSTSDADLPTAIPGPAITGAAREIQPHQRLIGLLAHPPRALGKAEGVDAARRWLYKARNGGGRNPAAAVFEHRRRMSTPSEPVRRGGAFSREHRKTYQRRSGEPSARSRPSALPSMPKDN